MNIGEEICGEWLRHVKDCEFVQFNLKTGIGGGEIDVIGLSLKHGAVYACEVAIHLPTGLKYVKENKPDNVPRLTAKLSRDIDYLQERFPDYEPVLMLWSPVVKIPREGSKHNQLRDVGEIVENIRSQYGLEVQAVINEEFQAALSDLRSVAGKETGALDSSVLRYLQIEEYLGRHLARLSN